MITEGVCPDCGHTWRAHQGRAGGQRCRYRPYRDFNCTCRTMNPAVAAEDQRAAAAWNALMGRT